MDKKKKKSHVSPIYAIAVVWLLMTLAAPLYSIGRIALTVLLSAAAFAIVGAIVKYIDKKSPEVREKAQEQKQEKTGETENVSPEVRKIIDEGKRAQSELGRLYASIPELSVKRKIRDIMEVADKIIEDAIEDPSDVPQIKKFLDYYLPTTIKLLNAYDRMGAQGIQGENISGTMKNIEEMLDTAIEAYHRLLDGLFANQALDIETDIEVMNTLLQREGLSGGAGA